MCTATHINDSKLNILTAYGVTLSNQKSLALHMKPNYHTMTCNQIEFFYYYCRVI